MTFLIVYTVYRETKSHMILSNNGTEVMLETKTFFVLKLMLEFAFSQGQDRNLFDEITSPLIILYITCRFSPKGVRALKAGRHNFILHPEDEYRVV